MQQMIRLTVGLHFGHQFRHTFGSVLEVAAHGLLSFLATPFVRILVRKVLSRTADEDAYQLGYQRLSRRIRSSWASLISRAESSTPRLREDQVGRFFSRPIVP